MAFLSSGNSSSSSTKVASSGSSSGLFSLKKKLFKSSTTTELLTNRELKSSSTQLHNTEKTKRMMLQNSNPFRPSSTASANIPATQISKSSSSKKSGGSSTPKRSSSVSNSRLNNIHSVDSKEKVLVYNPYGISNNANYTSTNSGSLPFTSVNTAINNNDISFYMHDGDAKIRMLPLPIEDPNSYLPEALAQITIHLNDNFILDKDNKTLGSGGSCEVRKIRSAYKAKNIYALKKLNMIYKETPERFYQRCSKEFIIAKTLSHNIHIINTYCLLKVPTTTYTTRGWGFVMEMGQGDLFQLIEKSGWKNVPLNEKYCIFKQVADGIKFCHDNGVAHRDLKPENVLMSKDGVCKLTDFGISDWYHEIPDDFTSPVKTCKGMIGSPPYAPPEVMYFDSKKRYSESLQKAYNPLALDTYALGIMLFTLVNGTIPFFESCNTDQRFRSFETSYENFIVYQNKYFRTKGQHKPGPGTEYSLSRNFRNDGASRVAWRLSDPKVETRYTMEDLYEDPWFKSIETCVGPDDDCNLHVPDIRPLKNTEEYISTANSISTGTINSLASTFPTSIEQKEPVDSNFYISGYESSKEDVKNGNDLLRESMMKISTPVGSPTSSHYGAKPKPRSMVDIANSPVMTKSNKNENSELNDKETQDPTLFTVNEESVREKLEEAEAENATNGTTSPSTNDSPSKIENPIPITIPIPKNILSEVSLNELPPIPISAVSSSNNILPKTISTESSSASSFRSINSTPRGKRYKHVVHNHMNVTNSINTMRGPRSFSEK